MKGDWEACFQSVAALTDFCMEEVMDPAPLSGHVTGCHWPQFSLWGVLGKWTPKRHQHSHQSSEQRQMPCVLRGLQNDVTWIKPILRCGKFHVVVVQNFPYQLLQGPCTNLSSMYHLMRWIENLCLNSWLALFMVLSDPQLCGAVIMEN